MKNQMFILPDDKDCIILHPRERGRQPREMSFSNRTGESPLPASHIWVPCFPDKPLSSMCILGGVVR